MKSQGGYPDGDFRIASENISLQLDLGHSSERREFNREAVRIFPLSFDSLFLFFCWIFKLKEGCFECLYETCEPVLWQKVSERQKIIKPSKI